MKRFHVGHFHLTLQVDLITVIPVSQNWAEKAWKQNTVHDNSALSSWLELAELLPIDSATFTLFLLA